ncbi:APC family permease [Azospirillum sp. TSO35-2]|uniref:APC family permease n=1 Tax=Azospirillum sp. TSO35-2 TaxID=716796 RepID=UPI000D60CCC0|nr:APC family permease [Azospirillum sp. TSO35-2]PWC36013.1 amino acid permease [Azospirillum sp. TSO35-2]
MTAPVQGPASSNDLRKGALGVGFIVFFVISAAGPLAAVAGGMPIGFMLGNGAGLPSLLLIVIAILLVFSAGYTAMARHVTHAGGFYALIARGFGGQTGAAGAALAILGYNAMQVGLYGLHGVATAGFVKQVSGIDLPWWVWAYSAMVTIAIFGYRRIDLSAKLLGLLVIGEYAVVLLLDLFILRSGGDAGPTMVPFTASALTSGAPAIGMLFCFAYFVGFEATTIYGEEARTPERTIPLATYLSVLLIGGFYAFSSWCMVVGAGAGALVDTIAALPDPTLFTFSLAERYAGPWLSLAMGALLVSSVYAGLLAFHNAAARCFYSIGRDGLLPDILGRTHTVHNSPHAGSLLQTGIAFVVMTAFVIAGSDPLLTLFSWLTNLATLCVIALMALTSFAVVRFFQARPELKQGVLGALLLPATSGLLLSAVLVLAVLRFDVLTGESGPLSWALPALLPAAGLAGILRAAALRRRSPERHARLGLGRA